MGSFLRKLSWLTARRRKEDELREELQFHLEEETRQLEAEGLPAEEARYAAHRDLGNVALVKEDTRATWSWTVLEQLTQDLRYGLRTMMKNRTFTALAVLSLALGIGANTAIYSFMDALLMRSLPVEDADSLTVLNWHVTGNRSVKGTVVHTVSGYFYDDPKTGKTASIFPYPAFELLHKSDIFSVLFAYHPAPKLSLLIRGQAEVASGEYVSGDYFRGLLSVPGAGRLILPDDDRAGAAAVVVLSYAFAQGRFGSAVNAAGEMISINNLPFTVIGVAPSGFFGVDPSKAPDFYLPLHSDLLFANSDERYLDPHFYWIEMMGRLRPGVTMAQAQQMIAPVFGQWVASTATNDLERKILPELLVKEGKAGLDNLRRRYSQPFYLLLALVGLILVIACANVANLLLARATVRRREIAVRLSVGAGQWRVIRQLLTESVLLASIGGAAGMIFAKWGVRILTRLLSDGPDNFPLHAELNWHVLLGAAALTMVTGLLFGLAPALQAGRVDVMPVLKETRLGERRLRMNLRVSLNQMLVVSQIAISLLLLVAAGLFGRTLSNLRSVETGFHRENVLLFKLNARQAGHRDPEIISFYRNLAGRFAAIPGVLGATAANSSLIGDGAWGWPVVPFGKPRPAQAPSGRGSGMANTATHVLATGPRFFTTMQIPLLAGREFDDRDGPGSRPVAIVNQEWVKANSVDRNPLGQHIVSFGPGLKPQEMEVVAVARNARYDDLTGNFPAIVYMPFEQNLNVPIEEMTFFLRTATPSLALSRIVREIVHQADARIPVTNLSTQSAQIDQEMSQEILFARLCTGLAILALAIACVGLYGTMSYIVARRTGEIGIRMALGAQRGAVVWMVIREVFVLAALGVVISLPAALGASKLIESFLYGVKHNDPVTLIAAAAILLTATLLAGYLPARTASRIDPMIAVRHE